MTNEQRLKQVREQAKLCGKLMRLTDEQKADTQTHAIGLETMSLHNLESIDKSSILEPVLITAEYPLESANRQSFCDINDEHYPYSEEL